MSGMPPSVWDGHWRSHYRAPVIRLADDEDIVDSFAGGGGVSIGIEWALGRSPDYAVNHDPVAIAMHQANHPRTKHILSNVLEVDFGQVIAPNRRCGLFWLSPDCTYHSIARGGKPFRDRDRALRIRGLAWTAVKAAKQLGIRKPRVIILENVREFADWGPLGDDGRPDPERAGITFKRFVRQLENLGYKVDFRDLVAADYGAPTSRRRLFLIARCDGRQIVWPQATHGPGRENPWRSAGECIQWQIPCPSIFERERPLAYNTERRIARGVFKFGPYSASPYIVPVMHGADARVWDIDEPMRTITGAHRGDRALITPYVARIGHTGHGGLKVRALAAPLPTVTSKNEHLLCAPTLIQTGYGEREGQAPRVPGLDKPLGTIVGSNKWGLVSAFLAKHNAGFRQGAGVPLGGPIHTITSRDHHALATSHLVKLKGTCAHGQALDAPMPTVGAQGMHIGEVRAFLIKFYSEGGQWGALDHPMGTITTRDRLGLVTLSGQEYVIADIGMRMLVPRELYRGQGVPDSYIITPLVQSRRTKKPKLVPLSQEKQVDMCGNMVPPHLACAVVRANFVEQYEEMAA